MSQQRFFLIDGSALAYRSYYAFQRNPLRTSSGEETSVAFGFAATILRLVTQEQPTHLAVLFDCREPTFRHKMYPAYKQNRKAMPEEMREQLPRLNEILEVMDVTTLRAPGFEADDLIGTIASKAAAAGWEVVIVSGDKDLFQLIDDRIKMLNLRKTTEAGEWFDREAVKAKMGVYPEQIIDLLALAGDSSDNVPGLAGVGPKTALKLLEQFGSFAAVFDNADQIKAKKLKESVTSGREKAYLSRQLVTIDRNVDFPYDLEQMTLPSLATVEISKLFQKLEFESLLKNIAAPAQDKQQLKQNYQTIDSEAALKEVTARIRKAGIFAFDTETDGLDPLTCNLVGISLAAAAGEAYYIPLRHLEGKNLDADICHRLLNPLLADPQIKKIAQNFKFDYHVLTRAGYRISNFDHDPMLASYILNPGSRRHGLSALALNHFDYRMQPISDLIGSGKKQLSFDTVPIDKATFYSAEDADLTFRLSETLETMVDDVGGHKLLHEIELPLSRVLAVMEQNGVGIDVELLGKMSAEMGAEIENIVHDVHTLAGREFNLNSPAQLADILFKELKLKPLRKTATKSGYSTDVNVLTELAR
ncbi:MAG: DNA polymerase I, partial [candidate division Zixibacteria bacterium]|nr:DNA polymerase I [candidate division Zixibacteria bacterium]